MKPGTWRAAVTGHVLPELPGDWAVSRDLAYAYDRAPGWPGTSWRAALG